MGTITAGNSLGALAQLRKSLTDSGDVSTDTLEFNREAAVVGTTELICQLMKEQNVSRAQLAERLGKSKSYVTQLLKGSQNMTLRTISDVFTHLGKRYEASYEGKKSSFRINASVSAKVVLQLQRSGDPFVDLGSVFSTPGSFVATSTDSLGGGIESFLAKSVQVLPS